MRVLRAAAFGLACGAAVAALAAPAAKLTNGKALAPTPKHSEEALPDGPLLPRYLLQDHNGRAVTHEDFRGRFQLVSFGFTSCPDVCPTTLVAYKNILAALGKQAERVQPIFISVDPERDTPSMLREYTTAFDPRILGLTASPELVRHAADSFKVRYEKGARTRRRAGCVHHGPLDRDVFAGHRRPLPGQVRHDPAAEGSRGAHPPPDRGRPLAPADRPAPRLAAALSIGAARVIVRGPT